MEAAEAAEANFVLQAMESIKQRARWTAGLDGPSGRYISDMGGREWKVMDWREGKANFLFTSIFHRPSPPLGVFCCRPKYGSLNGTTGTIGALTFFAFLLFSFLSPTPRFRQYFSHLFWFFIPKDLDPNFFLF